VKRETYAVLSMTFPAPVQPDRGQAPEPVPAVSLRSAV